MQIDGNWQIPGPRPYAAYSRFPLLTRFTGKLVLDILPAALASVIGGFLFTQYHLGRAAPPPATEQTSPASAEALALVRDEHQAIVGYLTAQLAAEKSRFAAQDADTARAVADAKAAQDNEAREKALAEQNAVNLKLAATSPVRHVALATKVALPRAKPTPAPTEVATAQAEPKAEQAAPADRLARDPDSLLAKTLDLKDHVVAATKQAVAALGDMFTSVGEHIGGSTPTARQLNSDS